MQIIIGFSVSILSIIIGIGTVIAYCIAYGIGPWSRDTATWVLFVFGAPTTLLDLLLKKTGFYESGFLKGIWNDLPIWILYLLQYQIIALLIYKGVIDLTTKKGIICLISIILIILISAKITWNVFRI